MLTFFDHDRSFNRREFLKIGSLGSLAIPSLLHASDDFSKLTTGKSVVFLFMHGGPSQTETFDPKMTAPAEIRSQTGEVQTTLPGVTFGGTFPKLAALADRMTIVRSFATGDSQHDIKPIVCRHTLNANIGSLYSRVVGVNHSNGMPTNAAIYPTSVDPETRQPTMNFGHFDSTGTLGKAYAPFVAGGDGPFQENMRLNMPMDSLEDRRMLLQALDGLKSSIDSSGMMAALERQQGQAFNTILGSVADAFDLSKEHPRVIDRYDTAPLLRPENIDTKWKNYKNYIDNAKTLGKLLLLARRLCEAGCGFVTITTNFVWDMHADQNNADVVEGMEYMGLPFDHAVSAFIEDVYSRGLSDKILLVACGEMGRTPKVNAKGGRDHWGRLAPLLVSGGGLAMGQVIGKSDRQASEPASRPYYIPNLVATIMNTLFDVGQVRVADGLPRDLVSTIADHPPIEELF